jgi:pimeloyl-ACP methyl ester carboxylesterase
MVGVRWPAPGSTGGRRGLALLIGAPGLVIAGAAASLMPVGMPGPVPTPHPARDYAEALSRFDRLSATDDPLNPLCGPRLFTHGARTGRVVVCLHGLTNCPQQFDSLSRLVFERGANVLTVRLPHHGLADRMTEDLRRLTARELAITSQEAVDIGRGLGDTVVVVGLSLGATAVAWIAQERADVHRVVAIAPVLGVAPVVPTLTPAVTRLLLTIPNRFAWWDDERREQLLGPPYVYPRFSTRALGETLRLGLAVMARARREAPRAASVVLVTIGGDHAINNAAIRDIEGSWKRRAPDRVMSYEFPAELHLNHDVIDPLQPDQRTDLTYPVLLDLIGG